MTHAMASGTAEGSVDTLSSPNRTLAIEWANRQIFTSNTDRGNALAPPARRGADPVSAG